MKTHDADTSREALLAQKPTEEHGAPAQGEDEEAPVRAPEVVAPAKTPRLPMGESFTVQRTDLLRELTKKVLSAGMVVLVAPEGFGKTALLLQYAEEVRSDPSRGMARVIDAAGLSCSEVLAQMRASREELPVGLDPLVAIDNVPAWSREELDRFARGVRALHGAGCEVVMTATPANRDLMVTLGDAEKIGAQSLKVRPREYAVWMRTFSIAGDLDVYRLTQGVPVLVAALSAVVEGTGASSALERYTEHLYRAMWRELEEGPVDILRAAGMLLLMGDGALPEVEASGVKVSQAARVRFLHDYPLFGIDVTTGSFACLGRPASQGALHRLIAERFAELPGKAVRALMRSGRVAAAMALSEELLSPEDALREIGRHPTACALAGKGAYVERIAQEVMLHSPGELPSVGCQLARYAAALTMGDFKTARALATELAVRAHDVEQEIPAADWSIACALRGVWASCPGIGLPSMRFKGGKSVASDAARKIRSFTVALRAFMEEKPVHTKERNARRASEDDGGRELPLTVADLFALCAELIGEVAAGRSEKLDERDARLEKALDALRADRLAPVLMLVRLVVSLRRVYAGKPVVDERAFADAGTMAIRTSDQPLQLLCLVLEGWQYLGMEQMVNAHFRAQQVIKLTDQRTPFIRNQAIVLEKISHICNTSRVALSEEAEVIDLGRSTVKPSEAWATALALAAVRFDAELSAWASLHKRELMDAGIRPAARLALHALGERAGAIVRLLPPDLQPRYQNSPIRTEAAQGLFEVVGETERVVVGQISIRLFGGIKIERNGHVLTSSLWRRRKTSALAARLALSPGAFVSRASLQKEFWPKTDYDHARNSLYSTLSVLRRALGQTKDGPQYLLVQGEGISFNMEYVTTDVMRFDMIAREVLLKRKGISVPQIIDSCLKIEQLYRGPLYMPDAGSATFFSQMREAYQTKFVDCMLRGIDAALEEEDLPTASWMVEAALSQAPMREDVVRQAMRVYERGGRRREIVELFHRHQEGLKRSGAAPELKTRLLYDRIVAGEGADASMRAEHARQRR